MSETKIREQLGARADYPLWLLPEMAAPISDALARLEAAAVKPLPNPDLDEIMRRVMANTARARRYLAR